jgi:two-component SAPR family response regulator
MNPMSLKVEVLGKERITLEDQIIPLSAFSAHQARELFFLAVEYPALTRDKVGAILWPDLSPELMTNCFHVTKARLNAALTIDDGQPLYHWNSVHQHYEFDHERVVVVYDVTEFERKVDLARRLPTGKQSLQVLQEAIALYRGAYLPRIFSEWAQIRRTGLEMKFIDALLICGEALAVNGDTRLALEYYRRVLEVDEGNEEALEHIQCLRPSEPVTHAHRSRRLLESVGLQTTYPLTTAL